MSTFVGSPSAIGILLDGSWDVEGVNVVVGVLPGLPVGGRDYLNKNPRTFTIPYCCEYVFSRYSMYLWKF